METDTSAQAHRGSGRFRVTVLLTVAALFVLGAAGPAQARGKNGPTSGEGEHCIAFVVDVRADGELIVGAPDCYGSFSQAMFVGSGGTWRLPYDAPVGVLESTTAGTHYSGFETMMGGSSPLATHYSLRYGRGSSITIYGSGCYGYWNTWTSWDNRISSTYNGCWRTTHYDWPNLSGSSASFTGYWLHNMTAAIDNRTESVKYSGF